MGEKDKCVFCIDCLDGMELLIVCGIVVKNGIFLYCVVCREGIYLDIYGKE